MKSKKKAQIVTLLVTVIILVAAGVIYYHFASQQRMEKESAAGQGQRTQTSHNDAFQGTNAMTEKDERDGLVLLEGGTFTMGSPDSERQRETDEVSHEVTLSPFYASPYEVSQKEYEEVMGKNPSHFKGDDLPVENVTWQDAVEYCNRLSESRGFTPVYTWEENHVKWNRSADGYRLLTEAEWEYAARAGSDSVFYAGDQITSEDANFEGSYPYLIEENYVNRTNSDVVTSDYRGETVSVDSLPPNAFGLYNMYGNVSEWCFDYYGEYDLEQRENPAGAASGSLRVNRGGSYIDFAKHLRSAYRSATNPVDTDQNLGFRIARNAEAVDGVVDTTYSLDIQMPDNPKILIAYFSYSGNTESAAKLLQEKTGADLVEIQMKKPYQGDIYEVSQKDLNEGEGYTLEYKESVNSLSDSVFETVSSFSNRYGGYILLGVKEMKRGNKKVGEVIGVNPAKVADMKQNFINLLNNPQKMAPSLYLNLEEIEYKGMIVLWVYVPVSSQIEICCGRIYDRNGDADQDVTTSADLVANISNRKSATYIERKIFPYAAEEDLCMDLVSKARQMAVNKFKDHPWGNMTDMELLRSAGLYEKDMESGKEGFNMACILLFGKPETIQSCVPGYKTDAIYRVENLDRYDDRLIVENNLLESYNLLIDFIKKHTDDKFFLIDGVNVSLRTAIAREIVSNLLVHREFKSAFPAKLIIEKDKIWTENWSRTQWKGRISLENFTPYPKNPIIAKFFVNIGYADSLGSGVRNLYKYTKIYSNAEPNFEENDVFRLIVPMRPAGAMLTNEGKSSEVTKVTEKVTDVTEKRILELLKDNAKYKTAELSEMLDISRKTVSVKLKNLREKGIIERVGSDRKGYWNIYL